jgi:hypothetical protein
MQVEAILSKLFCVFTSFLGCLVLLVAPFYVPFVNLLGAIAVGIASATLSAFMAFVATSGLNYAKKLTTTEGVPLSYSLTVYMVSMFSLLLSLLTFCRFTVWIFDHFFGMKIDWTFIPA